MLECVAQPISNFAPLLLRPFIRSSTFQALKHYKKADLAETMWQKFENLEEKIKRSNKMFKQFSNGLFEQDREEKEANIQRRVVSKFKKLSNFEI